MAEQRPMESVLNTLERDTEMYNAHLRANEYSEMMVSLSYIRAGVYELLQLLLGRLAPRQSTEEMSI
jgi:hypothetical protein